MSEIPYAKAAAAALNWYKSDEGHPGGSFVEAVYGAAALADVDNLAKLETTYPNLIRAFRVGRRPGGLDELRTAAGQTGRVFA